MFWVDNFQPGDGLLCFAEQVLQAHAGVDRAVVDGFARNLSQNEVKNRILAEILRGGDIGRGFDFLPEFLEFRKKFVIFARTWKTDNEQSSYDKRHHCSAGDRPAGKAESNPPHSVPAFRGGAKCSKSDSYITDTDAGAHPCAGPCRTLSSRRRRKQAGTADRSGDLTGSRDGL